jgi:hypothetical protein
VASQRMGSGMRLEGRQPPLPDGRGSVWAVSLNRDREGIPHGPSGHRRATRRGLRAFKRAVRVRIVPPASRQLAA